MLSAHSTGCLDPVLARSVKYFVRDFKFKPAHTLPLYFNYKYFYYKYIIILFFLDAWHNDLVMFLTSYYLASLLTELE